MLYIFGSHLHIVEGSGIANTEPFVAPDCLIRNQTTVRFTDRKEEIDPWLHLQQLLLQQIYGVCNRKSSCLTSKGPILVVGANSFNGKMFRISAASVKYQKA